MLKLKPVTEEYLEKYSEMVLQLCRDHVKLREEIGYSDYSDIDKRFNKYNIMGKYNTVGTYQYLIMVDTQIIGTVAAYDWESEVNHEPVIYIDSFYILPEYQRKGYGRMVIRELQKKFPKKKIELHCLYGNSAEVFYEKIGGTKVSITYSFDSLE